ncbi:MAG: hypothetical protein MUF54_26155 [Polyangiaceae bacterium]|jgi:uncharacterized integral membrane protein|nr:hypothetical protein [Polyangiaceae bacterium]
MARLILVVLITIVVVVLAMANMHHVELSLVVGRPAQVSATFLVASAYAAGVVSTVLWSMVRKLQRARDLRELQVKALGRPQPFEELEE